MGLRQMAWITLGGPVEAEYNVNWNIGLIPVFGHVDGSLQNIFCNVRRIIEIEYKNH